MAPAPYIRDAYAQPETASVPYCELRAGVDAERIYLRLRWPDADRDDHISDATTFCDAAAIVFAPDTETPLITMGDEAHPVTAVYWRAVDPKPLLVTARGLGSSRRELAVGAEHVSHHDGQQWWVAISLPRTVAGREGVLPFMAGAGAVFSLAVWEGSRRERAGIKSFAPSWHDWMLAD
jgi:DMSO reductase family type II enzyme heme b subunit